MHSLTRIAKLAKSVKGSAKMTEKMNQANYINVGTSHIVLYNLTTLSWTKGSTTIEMLINI
jgi:hypothetical protein